MAQLNFRPTRQQAGGNSSLLDLFLSNILERIKNVDNFYNTLSEHEGVKCRLITKSPVKIVKSTIFRDYTNATFNLMMPMVNKSHKLQSLFADTKPEVIAKKLTEGLKEITDLVVTKRRLQPKNRGY